MGEGLRKIAEGFALEAGLFGVEIQVIGVAEHAFEEKAGFVEPCRIGVAGASQGFDQPERAHVESAFFAG